MFLEIIYKELILKNQIQVCVILHLFFKPIICALKFVVGFKNIS